MKYILKMPPDKIMFLAMILESYEDVAIVTTLIPASKNAPAVEGSGKVPARSLVVANVVDDFDRLFHSIINSLADGDIKAVPAAEYEAAVEKF